MSYELPNGKSPSFIAYGAPETIPAPDGTATTGRPQIYVRWFDSIKIQNIKDGGRTGKGDTVGIEFDAKSVDFDNDFMAYMNPNDPTLAAIREAYAAGAGIQIALESVRKVKAKSSGEPIAKTTPIHALRGAKQDGSKGSMDASGDNVRNLVAMVDFMPTETINSNPREWKFLAKNRTGEIAPPGWRYVGDKDDWTKLGVVIESSHQSTGGSMDEGTVAAIAAAVADLIGTTNGGINSTDIAREVRRGVFNEGKPWNARTSNGMVNLGSYLLGKNRAVFIEALDITKDNAQASELTRRILFITDKVQADSYGNNIKADRLAPSHTEAGKWVSFVLQQGAAAHYPMDAVNEESEVEAQKAARDEWCAKVAAVATQYFSGAAQIAREYLESLAATADVVVPADEASAGQGPAEGETADEAVPAEQKAVEAPTEGGQAEAGQSQRDMARSLAEALTATWNDASGLGALRAPIQAQGLLNAPVSIAAIDGKPVIRLTLDVEGQEGWAHGTVVNFVNRRLMQLEGGAQGPAQVEAPTAAAGVSPEPQGPQEAVQPVLEPAAEPTAEPAAEPAAEPTPEAASTPAVAAEASAAYPAPVQAIIERLQSATADDMGGIFADASASSLLDQRVAVKPVGTNVEFGSRGEVGYLDLPLSQIITRMLENLGASAAADKQAARAEEAAAEPATKAEDPKPAAKSKPAAKAKVKAEAAPAVAEPAPETGQAEPEFNEDETGEGGDASPAQLIADLATAESDNPDTIAKLIEDAKAKGLTDENIIIGELEGGLLFYLVHLQQEANKKLATV